MTAAIAHTQAAAPDRAMLIENVTVISSERAASLLHASVVIRGGRIVEIGTNLRASASMILIGESSLSLYLLINGVQVEGWNRRQTQLATVHS